MKKFDVTTWKNEIRASLPNLEKMVADAKERYETARRVWREDNYSDWGYEMYRMAEKELWEMERDLERSNLLVQDQLYCNQHFYTDIEAWEVIGYVSEKCLIIREMKAELKPEAAQKLGDSFVPGGFCGHFNNDLQEWDIVPDPEGEVIRVRLHKDGCYHQAGSKGTRFYLEDKPRKYYDYNF